MVGVCQQTKDEQESVEESALIQLRGPATGKEKGTYLQTLLESCTCNTFFTHRSGDFIYQNIVEIISPTQDQILINQNKLGEEK